MNAIPKKSIAVLLPLLLAGYILYGQSFSRDMEITVEEFRINRSPVKTQHDLYEYYLQPQQAAGRHGFIHALSGDTAIAFRYDTVSYFNEGLAAICIQGKWGFINPYGKLVIPCSYDSADNFSGGLCLVKRGLKLGYINKSGKEMIPCEFDELAWAADNLIWVKQKDKYGLYHTSGQLLSAPRFDGVNYFREERAWVQKGDKWGFINKEGVMLISPKYDWGEPFNEGMAAVRLEEGSGYVNKTGDEVIPPYYEEAQNFSEGLAAVKTTMEGEIHSWIYVDRNNDLIITNVGSGITQAGPFRNGYASVYKGDEKAGLIDKTGREVVPCEYEMIGELRDSLVAVKKYGKWGYCNLQGELVISCRFEEAEDFENGQALVKSGDSYFINKKGEYLKPLKNSDAPGMEGDGDNAIREKITIDYINTRGEKIIRGKAGVLTSLFFNGMTPVRSDNKWGFMNKEGVLSIPCAYDSAGSFSEGLAPVRINRKWGFIYQDGDTLMSGRYEYAYGFNKGMAIVKMNGRYGYLGKTGNLDIPCRYDMAYTFKDSLALVRLGDQFGFINKTGEPVIPARYDDAFDFNEGLAPVQQDGRWGYIDKKGNQQIPLQYAEAGSFQNGLALVRSGDQYGYIDRTGTVVIPFRYKSASSFSEGTAFAEDSDGEILLIDPRGNELFSGNFRSGFHEELAIVENENGKKGFMNRQGKIQIPCQFDEVIFFREGLAAVAVKNKWGFINKQGTLVIPLQFDMALVFNEGLGVVITIAQ